MDLTHDTLHFHSADGWDGLVASRDWLAQIQNGLDDWLAANPGEVVVSCASRDVRRIPTTQGVVYVKYIRALTDAGLAGKEWFSWLKWVLRPSRALATWRISRLLLQRGFACPPPILAARRRLRGYPTDIFVAGEIPLPDLWKKPCEAPEALAQTLAAETARFHQDGFAHGDFILRNLCLNPKNGQLVFLDNDRTWRPPFLRAHYQRRNLAQMTYSLLRRFEDPAIPQAFLTEYARLTYLPAKVATAILAAAQKRLAQRNARN